MRVVEPDGREGFVEHLVGVDVGKTPDDRWTVGAAGQPELPPTGVLECFVELEWAEVGRLVLRRGPAPRRAVGAGYIEGP